MSQKNTSRKSRTKVALPVFAFHSPAICLMGKQVTRPESLCKTVEVRRKYGKWTLTSETPEQILWSIIHMIIDTS